MPSFQKLQKPHYNFLVLGSGLAGLAFALQAQRLGSVAVISKTSLAAGNTERAQGGIAAVTAKEDSVDRHIADTLAAGVGLCDPKIVDFVVSRGPKVIEQLVNWGVQFDVDQEQRFSLTKEGGHSERRILHVEDHTGQDIHRQLLTKLKTETDVDFYENCFAIDLITNQQLNEKDFSTRRVVGAYILEKQDQNVVGVSADNIILATGGSGKTYLYTSNWEGATGDGIAMAYRVGARVANLEFTQFHPTCLFHPHARNFLISEALRGEGGELRNSKGEAFMQKHHPMGSLAPRDIVARSIDAEMRASGADCVFLDMTSRSPDFLKTRFPKIYAKCLEHGIDITQQPIPVVPAAHYQCGGILTDANGQTDVQNLFAIGEVACTGLHGANRLASNSLLECLVFADSAYEQLKNTGSELSDGVEIPAWKNATAHNADEMMLISHMWDEVRRLMWAYVGIVRSDKRLARAQSRLRNILLEFRDYYSQMRTHSDIIELRNIAIVADLTVKCALMRKESIGIHYNLDCPLAVDSKNRSLRHSVLPPRSYDF